MFFLLCAPSRFLPGRTFVLGGRATEIPSPAGRGSREQGKADRENFTPDAEKLTECRRAHSEIQYPAVIANKQTSNG
jgi:hypothetical protein